MEHQTDDHCSQHLSFFSVSRSRSLPSAELFAIVARLLNWTSVYGKVTRDGGREEKVANELV